MSHISSRHRIYLGEGVNTDIVTCENKTLAEQIREELKNVDPTTDGVDRGSGCFELFQRAKSAPGISRAYDPWSHKDDKVPPVASRRVQGFLNTLCRSNAGAWSSLALCFPPRSAARKIVENLTERSAWFGHVAHQYRATDSKRREVGGGRYHSDEVLSLPICAITIEGKRTLTIAHERDWASDPEVTSVLPLATGDIYIGCPSLFIHKVSRCENKENSFSHAIICRTLMTSVENAILDRAMKNDGTRAAVAKWSTETKWVTE
jgi:hypothetical protein